MKKMYGVVPPMITPFKENGDVDIANLKVLVEFLSQNVDGLFVTGSYGSGPLMSLEERKQVVEVSVATAAGRVPVIPMIGTTTNRDSVELARHAESCGAMAVAAVGPFYFSHKEDALLQFYTDLIESVDIPVYLYNNPGFQGYQIGLETLKKLKARGLGGVKDATFDILTHATYQRVLADDTFDVALGTEAMFASACVLGCKAFIPGLANAFPEINREMFRQGMEGDFAGCGQTQFKINELRDVMYLARSTQLAVYAMLEVRGVMKAYPRKPFLPATEQEKAAIRKELQRLQML
ncbi:MAG: dihydrodipicolinate synthase family protein [Sphaerochaetaceae bacterium]|jgi:dihydrodipicolinate synthase/N-acetylneuraminate lyase|nr:dihydrodipicolinate synthase family protein [Sphaerochaetaceae bacterium]MDX9940364.1 dihydrodipicolinate synthase family protein [Sphaerochaetaceae bacterium]